MLKNNGVYGYFDGFVTTEEAGAEKDCPDIYLLAAKNAVRSRITAPFLKISSVGLKVQSP